MSIPETRAELLAQLDASYGKLRSEIEHGGPRAGSLRCIDDWTVKELLAVRAWWTETVVAWVVEWRAGGSPITPAPGYRWKETPRLNDDIALRARRESYASVRKRLDKGFAEVLKLVDDLSDHELLDTGVFPGAGGYPIRRWISLNTVRQYTTARSFMRRAVREHRAGDG
jgi:hypothetical protein